MDSDEEFLLVAYQEYINEIEDWPNFRNIPGNDKYLGKYPKPIPLLIRECGRLIPVIEPKANYVCFHPFNMPTTIIKKIHIIGSIVGIKDGPKYKQLSVNDGTGMMTVLHNMTTYETELKHRATVDQNYGIAARDLPYLTRLMKRTIIGDGPRKEMQKKNEAWWAACRHGMLGKPLDLGGYVSVYGYCNIKRSASDGGNEGNNFWKSGNMPPIIFNAYEVMSLSEKEYNAKLEELVNEIAKKRYTAD